jgi:hypothetical protein
MLDKDQKEIVLRAMQLGLSSLEMEWSITHNDFWASDRSNTLKRLEQEMEEVKEAIKLINNL